VGVTSLPKSDHENRPAPVSAVSAALCRIEGCSSPDPRRGAGAGAAGQVSPGGHSAGQDPRRGRYADYILREIILQAFFSAEEAVPAAPAQHKIRPVETGDSLSTVRSHTHGVRWFSAMLAPLPISSG
jgi:hypothetical protein